MAGYAELFDVEGRNGITRLKAAPVKKQPSQVTVRLRFQLMGVSAEGIGFHWPAAQVK
jgi:hypothetical protein